MGRTLNRGTTYGPFPVLTTLGHIFPHTELTLKPCMVFLDWILFRHLDRSYYCLVSIIISIIYSNNQIVNNMTHCILNVVKPDN